MHCKKCDSLEFILLELILGASHVHTVGDMCSTEELQKKRKSWLSTASLQQPPGLQKPVHNPLGVMTHCLRNTAVQCLLYRLNQSHAP